jgi:hypothetical protein
MVKVAMYSLASQVSSFDIGNLTKIEPYFASCDLLPSTRSCIFGAALKFYEPSPWIILVQSLLGTKHCA